MLSNKHKDKLKANWGERAETMECNAEVRVYDPLSKYECYIFALNPEDENEIWCIINGFSVETDKLTLGEIASYYNSHGEGLQVDYEYRPRQATEVYRSLTKEIYYERNRY